MKKSKNDISWSSARKICIVKTLASSGHYPTKKSEKEAWFLSPLRSETQASFSVSLSRNLWFDFGLGKGGNIIDLVMAINNCSAYEAERCLQDNIQFSFCPVEIPKKSNPHHIREVKTISHPALVQYLHSRKIPLDLAQNFCREVWHSMNNKIYFSLGLQNDANGWELRNKYFKCSTSPKTTSSFKRKFAKLLILEGMFDFLSLNVLDKELFYSSDIIVLNSLGNISSIENVLTSYAKVILLLDNDPAGRTTAGELLFRFPNTRDISDLYKDYKDLNNMLTHGRIEK
ncbi:toprim domain-containing protein [Salinimicrobium terrae]|uniref:toprim domain-containing protein n=1 Tax=Salinimicrobium terrae TaxID=470866 RepID=UPI0004186659|nr:toprim domain-containing protein [Salinimicrobium terrae]